MEHFESNALLDLCIILNDFSFYFKYKCCPKKRIVVPKPRTRRSASFS